MKNFLTAFKTFRGAIVLFNVISLLFYGYIFFTFGGIPTIKESLYSTGDAMEYQVYSQWLGGEVEYCNPVRTFFFPFLILLSESLAGENGVFILQFLLWIGGLNLLFLSLFHLLKIPLLVVLVALPVAFNLSIIDLTFHALCEVPVFFLMTFTGYYLSRGLYSSEGNLFMVILALSLLAVTKPLYQPFWYFMVLVILFLGYRKRIFTRKAFLLVWLAISPVLVQKTISLVMLDKFSSTEIAASNFRLYFFRKTLYLSEKGTLANFDFETEQEHDRQRKVTENYSYEEMFQFLMEHPVQTLQVFYDNLEDNLRSGAPYIHQPEWRSFFKWTENTNDKLFFLHLLTPFLFLIYFFKKGWQLLEPVDHYLVFGFTLLVIILYSSGLVFWAGDRLVAPSVALYFSVYFLLVQQLWGKPLKKSN